MPKHLSDMTLEELWQMFPVMLTLHQDCWDTWYEEENILVEVPQGRPMDAVRRALVLGGWGCMHEGCVRHGEGRLHREVHGESQR